MRSSSIPLRATTRFLAGFFALQLFFGIVTPFVQAETMLIPTLFEGELSERTFDPNYVLDDQDIFGLGDMRLGDIQSFLEGRPGILDTYRTQDIDGVERSVAEIIWRISSTYQLNPRYLLALLQKEQSLVDDPSPSQKQFDWATGYAICDSCSMNDPRLQEFRGLASQLEWAAKQHRERYLMQILGRGATIAGQAPGKTVSIDGRSVTPVNNATAMLYSYTPHIAGNFSLWKIWQRWFALRFPEGTVVRGKTSRDIYLLRHGERRSIKNEAIAASLIDPAKIVTVEDSRLSAYRLGSPVNFPNYSLIQTTNGTRYLLTGTNKRLIQPQAFEKFGFNQDELIEVTGTDLDGYGDGPDITTSTTYPTGLLVKDPQKVYWYIENNLRQRIPDTAFLDLYFRGRRAKLWTAKQVTAVPEGSAYGLQDGELVRSKTSPAVYAIEAGQRRPIQTERDFLELGYQWKNVVTLPDRLLANYPIGSVLDPHGSFTPPTSDTSLTLVSATGTVQAAAHPHSN
jgi:hypothetical protein